MIKLNFTLILLFIYFQSFCQYSNNIEVISTAGGYFAPEGSNVTISFTLGEPVIETYTTPDKTIILTQGFQQPDIPGILFIEGYVTYDNSSHTPMASTWVFLYDSELIKKDSTYTDISGHFIFNNVTNGNYTIRCVTDKAYGGEDPVDALFANLNYIGKYSFRNALAKRVSDVNGDSKTTPTDGLLINRRFIKATKSYKSGDWAFEDPSVIVSDASVKRNIKALCFGDIDGSYNVPNKKAESELVLENEGTIVVRNMQKFELPITVTRDMYLGAMGLVIDYPSHYLKVTDVISDIPGYMFNILDGEVRIAWSDIAQYGLYLSNNSQLIKLKMVVNNINDDRDVFLRLTNESKLTDNNGKSLRGEILHIPKIAFETSTSGYYLGQNYPNPFKNSTRIDYRLAETANVSLKLYDLLGKEVAVLADGNQTSGYHQINVDVSDMTEGVYMYKFVAEGSSSKFIKTRMMVISK